MAPDKQTTIQRPSKSVAGPSTSERVTNVPESIEQSLLVLYEHAEAWQKDNIYILSGYRRASRSVLGSCRSLGYLHNETVNIYSHLLGAVAAVVSSFFVLQSLRVRYPSASSDDVLVFSCFFAGLTLCLGMSGLYHTISNHSDEMARFWNQLDYLGIVFLIWGSFIPTLYYAFWGHTEYIHLYWAMITTFAIGCSTVTLLPAFRSGRWRPFRAGMYSAMGLSGVIPIIHGLFLFGFEELSQRVTLHLLILQGVLYLSGATIYATRVPERLNPGFFDIFGSSHQIFHVLVLLAAFTHATGVIRSFDYSHGIDTPGPPEIYFLGNSRPDLRI